MKKKPLFLFSVLMMFLVCSAGGQDNEAFTINNVEEHASYEAVYKAFRELKLPHPSINKSTHSGISGYVTYSNLMFKNRFKYGIAWDAGSLTIFITEKQYYSENGWVENLLPMSKNQLKKQLDPLEEKLKALLKEKPFIEEKAVGDATGNNHPGIYEQIALIRTDDPALEVLMMAEGTEVAGFDLKDDYSGVESFVYMASPEHAPFIIVFDEDGKPAQATVAGFMIDIYNVTENAMTVGLFDTTGAFLGDETVTLDRERSGTFHPDNKGKGGPSGFSANIVFDASFTTDETETLSKMLDLTILAANGVMCVATMPTGLGALVPCGSFMVGASMMVLPEASFAYKQLANVDLALSLIPFKNPAKTAENIGNVAYVMKTSIESAMKYFSDDAANNEITVTGPHEVRLGVFGELGDPITIYARSTEKIAPLLYRCASDAIFIEEIEKDSYGYREGHLGLEVLALRPEENGNVEIIFSQNIAGKGEINRKKTITVKSPNYYYLPSCDDLLKEDIITADQYLECDDDNYECTEILDKRGDIVLTSDKEMLSIILNEHVLSATAITDPDMKLNSEKLNYVRKLWRPDGTPYPADEAGALRDFVKKAPCACRWLGVGDARDLISLGNEGKSKLAVLDEKIETLRKNATAENWNETEEMIKSIKGQMDTIRAEYEVKMNNIAAKKTISWPTSKSDTNSFYQQGEIVEVYGVRWNSGMNPDILITIPFTPIRKMKTIEYYKGFSRTFQLDIDALYVSFEDGTDKPLKLGFSSVLNKEFNSGIITSFIRFNKFSIDIERVNYYDSRADATEIK